MWGRGRWMRHFRAGRKRGEVTGFESRMGRVKEWDENVFAVRAGGQWVHCELNTSSSACADRGMQTHWMRHEQRRRGEASDVMRWLWLSTFWVTKTEPEPDSSLVFLWTHLAHPAHANWRDRGGVSSHATLNLTCVRFCQSLSHSFSLFTSSHSLTEDRKWVIRRTWDLRCELFLSFNRPIYNYPNDMSYIHMAEITGDMQMSMSSD